MFRVSARAPRTGGSWISGDSLPISAYGQAALRRSMGTVSPRGSERDGLRPSYTPFFVIRLGGRDDGRWPAGGLLAFSEVFADGVQVVAELVGVKGLCPRCFAHLFWRGGHARGGRVREIFRFGQKHDVSRARFGGPDDPAVMPRSLICLSCCWQNAKPQGFGDRELVKKSIRREKSRVFEPPEGVICRIWAFFHKLRVPGRRGIVRPEKHVRTG